MSIGDMLVKVQRDIERVGWSSIGVFGDDDNPQTFTYSIGFQEHDHPEVIVAGLQPALAHRIIGILYDRVVDGEPLQAGERYTEILEGYEVEVRSMPSDGRPLNMARAYYGVEELPALQIVWPDKNAIFPGEEGFDPEYEGRQDLVEEQVG